MLKVFDLCMCDDSIQNHGQLHMITFSFPILVPNLNFISMINIAMEYI